MSRRKKGEAGPNPITMMAPTELWRVMGKDEKPWTPHTGQIEMLSVVKSPWPGMMQDGRAYPSIFSFNCGRQFGKTEVGHVLLWQGALADNDDVGPPQVRLTSDTEEHALKIWDRFLYTVNNTKLGQTYVKSYSADRHLVTLHTGATVQMIPGYNPAALSGDSVTMWVVDEAQFFSDASYQNMLPSVLARNGVIVLMGVAEGSGPFKETSWRGEMENREAYPRYLTLRYSSYDNPYVKPDAVDLMAETLTPELYAARILAQWGKGLGRVFGDVRALVDPLWEIKQHPTGFYYTQLPLPGNLYFGGLDIARFRDWTVYEIYNSRGELVAWDRFHQMSFESQYTRLLDFHKRYNSALTAVDKTSIGIAPVERMRHMGMLLRDMMISSNQEKRRLIDQLSLRISEKGFRFPKWDQFLREMDRYEATEVVSPNGNTFVRYGAPSGFFDDTVMAAALATEVLPKRSQLWTPPSSAPAPRQKGVWEAIGGN